MAINNVISDYYSGKKVLVTGHTGFKGAWLITCLHLMGTSIKGYALAPENEQSLFDTVKNELNIDHEIGDIMDKEALENAILTFEPDFIFHLAAQALVRKSYQIPTETFEVNAIGTANVLYAVKKLKKKCTVVVITTDKVYENKEIDYHYIETDTLGGYDPYSASKAAAEIVISSYRNSFFLIANYTQHQKVIISARAGNVIGGGDWSKDRMIPDIIKSLSNHQPIKVRNPNSVRPWQHVLEPIHGYLLVGMLADKEPVTYSGAYNFGPKQDDHLHVKNLVDIAIDCWGNGEWVDVSDPSQPHEAGLLKLSIQKAADMLHWQPKLTSKQSIEWTINWYKQPTESLFNFTLQQIKQYWQL